MDSQATLQVYKELADWYERQGEPALRDRFLVLAAETAFSAGKPDEAERLRQRLLQGNPHHMLKPYSSFSEAMQSTILQIYIHDLQQNYPPESAEGLLQKVRSSGEPATHVPQTAPVLEVRDEPTLPLGSTADSLKVYPLRDEPDATVVPPAPVKPTHLNRPPAHKPKAAPPAPSPPAPAHPAATNPPPARPQPASARLALEPAPLPAAPSPEPAESGGAWLTFLLYGMTVTAGVALAAYTLSRPFLPPQWLP
jgi:hypothetical protein